MQVSYNKGNSEASAVGTVAKDLLRLITDAYFSKKGLGHFIRIKTATNPSRHFIPKKRKKNVSIPLLMVISVVIFFIF